MSIIYVHIIFEFFPLGNCKILSIMAKRSACRRKLRAIDIEYVFPNQ